MAVQTVEVKIALELLDNIEKQAREYLGARSMPIPPESAMVLIGAYREHLLMQWWRPIETAPKGGGAELVTDPKWVEPPRILLRFGDEAVSVAYWDWYYAEGGAGYRDGFAWIEPCSSEPLNLHYSMPPTHWMPVPAQNENATSPKSG